MVLVSGFVHQTRIADVVSNPAQLLASAVVQHRNAVGSDTSGGPAICFRIILADWAAAEPALADVTDKTTQVLLDTLNPYEDWEFVPNFSFRGASDQRADEAWG